MIKQFKVSHSITVRSEVLDSYLNQINAYPLLSLDEEVELANIYARRGDSPEAAEAAEKAKERLVNSNLRFVVSVAKQYQNQGIPLEDLIMEGNMGLIVSVDHFDVSRGFKFISYAVWWIRQAIMQSIAEKGRVVRLPLNQVGLQTRIRKEAQKFLQENQRPALAEELAERLGMSEDMVRDAMLTMTTEMSIDRPVGDDSDSAMSETMADTSMPSTDSAMMEESLRRDILASLKLLKDARERDILVMSFGMSGMLLSDGSVYSGTEVTLDEIGNRLGLTRERVRQIREKSLNVLRNNPRAARLRTYIGK